MFPCCIASMDFPVAQRFYNTWSPLWSTLLISLLLIVLHELLFLLFLKPERQTSRLYIWYLYLKTKQNKTLIYSVSSSNLVMSKHMAFYLRIISFYLPCNCIPVWNGLHIKPACLSPSMVLLSLPFLIIGNSWNSHCVSFLDSHNIPFVNHGSFDSTFEVYSIFIDSWTQSKLK